MKRILAATALAASMFPACAANVTLNFDSINYAPSYSESGFDFNVVGDHTDASDYVYFRKGGSNPSNNFLTMSFGGNVFSLVEIEIVDAFSSLTIKSGAVSQTFNRGASGTYSLFGFTDITSAIFEIGGESGASFDNLVADYVAAGQQVPEPYSLALLGLGLASILATRKARR